ncbi:MAG: hypothetical protein MRY21_07155 [Simkaniaceae bacterium]|nr:hypothetical protein [Simkaniaceae bacterium]
MELRRLLPIALAFFASGYAQYEKRAPVDNHFAIEADFLYYDRTECDDNRIAEYDLNHCDIFQQTLSTKDVAHEMADSPGLRACVYFMPHAYQTVELRYVGLLEWHGTRRLEDTAAITFPFKFCTVDWSLADRLKAQYWAKFYSADLMWWHHVNPRDSTYFNIGWALGLRYADIDEEFETNIYKSNRQSLYDINTRNDMMGIQGAFEFSCHPYRWITWGFTIRAALYADVETEKTLLTDDNGSITLRKQQASGVHETWSGEADIFLKLDIYPTASIRLAYDALYFRNVAVAGDQIHYSKEKIRMDHNGSVGYYGLEAGLIIFF